MIRKSEPVHETGATPLVPRPDQFAGLLNYRWLARSPATLTAIRVTLVYVVVTTLGATLLAAWPALSCSTPRSEAARSSAPR